ncbi:MMS19 nucleotide excision repair protein homolog isoform X2 [Amborella trichopoda]|uniref:MMS19 nucleotide excision repair protein n=1 Tax=Amborella trichopoda TaxID=13333 RepID=U5CYC2_AMBTC|nr:MMS19 nucleotide excision repair protein homolog isoform X2 [Amborella trichopoda]ERN15159.1 hypothetical protein AMTR_s00056p00136660 [Amborella trichopoda]|eukprot:XP_006853692.3 MMS19 nucleotide excision repair protein homolog isoform X2 [Amborella trichopoda]
MASTASWIPHVEVFVDPSRSKDQQDASLNVIATLMKKDTLTLEALVQEMEVYLTTTDASVRSRGILLVAELLSYLASKPIDGAIIHSLTEFFTSRLADWQALRGAFIGCLALLRRKSHTGTISDNDLINLTKSFLLNIQVQALALHDRLLCLELLECLLDQFPSVISVLDDELVYGVLAAIDEEKDPRCLMLVFHVVELLVQVFPDPSVAKDAFDILGRYFPIYFTRPNVDAIDIKREDLSRRMMNAFSSSPLFEPFCIPLLLEKLSSSLEMAKLDALKYLSHCAPRYGPSRMASHAYAIWSALKDVIFNLSSHGPSISIICELPDNLGSQENEVVKEALVCLENCVLVFDIPKDETFLRLIVEDEDLEMTFRSITSEKCNKDLPHERKQRFCALRNILFTSAKVSSACCNRVFGSFFQRLMNFLRISSLDSPFDWASNRNSYVCVELDFEALHICLELIAASNHLANALSSQEVCPTPTQDPWLLLLQSFSGCLVFALGSSVVANKSSSIREMSPSIGEEDLPLKVTGLQILATFPDSYSPLSRDAFENILAVFMSVITERYEETSLWTSTLKALVQVGMSIERYHDSQRGVCFMTIVIEKLLSYLFNRSTFPPLSLNLKAISEIAMMGLCFMKRVTKGFGEALSTNFLEAVAEGNTKSAEMAIEILKCYSLYLLPWLQNKEGFEEDAMHLATDIWSYMESISFCIGSHGKSLLEATMMAMKLAVGCCTMNQQSSIVSKAHNILASSTLYLVKDSMSLSTSVQLEKLKITPESVSSACKDGWLISLFASVVIALQPQTVIPDLRIILELFMIVVLLKGDEASAQALGSIVNKWPVKSNEVSGACTLGEAMDIMVERGFRPIIFNVNQKKHEDVDNNKEIVSHLPISNDSRVHALFGLAWIGKGLVMRGHEKVKDITLLLLSCVLPTGGMRSMPSQHDVLGNDGGESINIAVARSAADAFHIIMSDSETSVNQKFHATIRPLYKQRFCSTVMPILLSSIKESHSSITKSMLFRTFGHIIIGTPLAAILIEAPKIVPPLLDGLSMLTLDVQNKDQIYDLLVVLSGILMDETGKEAVVENAHTIIGCLSKLVTYPHLMIVRETAIQCLVAMAALPHARIYPMRLQVLETVSKALDDQKRSVRQEAVRCHHVWASMASRSLRF